MMTILNVYSIQQQKQQQQPKKNTISQQDHIGKLRINILGFRVVHHMGINNIRINEERGKDKSGKTNKEKML